MKQLAMVAGVLAGVVSAGCETMGTTAQSKTVQGAVTGGALGAGTGAIIGHQQDKAGEGAAIGAAVGALGGGLIGHGLEAPQPGAVVPAPPAAAKTKFCPVGGELYGPDVMYCPKHGVELRYKE